MQVELSKQDLVIILECLHSTTVQGRSAKRFSELLTKVERASIGPDSEENVPADYADMSD